MNLKKELAVGAATLALIGSVMNVSAAKISPDDYVNTLIQNKQESLILNVDAYKAAYPDLARSFGNDSAAYLTHYLTQGVYEGRTKGVLFDPLLYAESYSDVKGAYGYDISAIVEHYIQFGITENRTQGTAHGFADIAAAEKAGVQSTNISRDKNAVDTAGNSTNSNNEKNPADNGNNGNRNTPAGGNAPGDNNAGGNSGNNAPAGNTPADNSAANAPSPAASSAPAPADTSAAPAGNSAPASTDASATGIVNDYHHTTSIYDNDEQTLLRVEYYDSNGNLINYSSVTNFDTSTNSYTEEIYHFDQETQTSVLDRTDTYVNGSLSSSQMH